MTRRRPSLALASAMRRSSSASGRLRYRSGRDCRSEMCSFSYAVIIGSSVDIIGPVRDSKSLRPACELVKLFASEGYEKAKLPALHGARPGAWRNFNYISTVGVPLRSASGVHDHLVERIPFDRVAPRRSDQTVD